MFVSLNYMLQQFLVRYLMVSSFLGQNINAILLKKNHGIILFLQSVSVMEIVIYLPICVWTQVDGRRYMNTDRCSLLYAKQWFAFIDGHG